MILSYEEALGGGFQREVAQKVCGLQFMEHGKRRGFYSYDIFTGAGVGGKRHAAKRLVEPPIIWSGLNGSSIAGDPVEIRAFKNYVEVLWCGAVDNKSIAC